MEQGELGYISRFHEQNSRGSYAWLRGLCLGLLLFAFIITVADDLFAQGSVPTEPEPASVEEPVGKPLDVTEPKPINVPEVVVKQVRERKTSYAVDEVSSATRMPVPVHDIPRSVETVTRQVIEDQKV